MNRSNWANVALCVILGLLIVFAVTRFSSALTPKGLLVSEEKPSAEAAALLPKVVLAGYNVGESTGHMVNAEFYVRNNSDEDVKNLDILCEFYNDKGAYMDRKFWTLTGPVPAGKSIQHSSISKRFINSRTRHLNCRITDLQVAEASFFTLHRASEGHGEGAVSEHGQVEQHGAEH